MPTHPFQRRNARRDHPDVRLRTVRAPSIIPLGALLALAAAPFWVVGPARAQAPTSNPNEEAAIRALVNRVVASWPDGDAIAALSAEEIDFIVGDGTHLTSPEAVAAYFASFNAPLDDSEDAFATSLQGTTVTAEVQRIRFLAEDVAVGITKGGIMLPDESEVPPERLGIQTFVLVKVNGSWRIAAYQNTRIQPQP